jgi:hypothetical protein
MGRAAKKHVQVAMELAAEKIVASRHFFSIYMACFGLNEFSPSYRTFLNFV